MPNLEGQDVDRYHVVEHIGKGGMAYVYKAYDNRLDRHVALKVIIMNEQDDMTKFFKRFEREAKALAKLSHPHIVKIHDYGDYRGAPYLVMEFLEGGTLKSRLGKPMPYAEAARLLIPIAQALDYAHGLNIIHRDVKPANIMLTKTGLPMLTDFGIAKILEGAETTELTGTGVGIGTPDYMSPEQGQGIQVDFRTDIYSLGVVFYELVTGKKPFHADTPIATIIKHITGELPRPRTFVPNLPDEVENVIFKAMAKNAVNRYQTMGDFAHALELLTQVKPQLSSETPTVTAADLGETIAPSATPMRTDTTPRTETAEAPDDQKATVVAPPSSFQDKATATQTAPPDQKATVAMSSFPPQAGEVFYNYPNDAQAPAIPATPVPPVSADAVVVPGIEESKFKKFWTRPSIRGTRRILTIILIFLLSLSLLSCLFLSLAAYFAGNAIRDAVAASEFISFEEQQAQFLTEEETESIINTAVEPFEMWIFKTQVDYQSPNLILLSADTSLGAYDVRIEVNLDANPPKFIIRSINGFPLLIVGGILSNGINDGFVMALDKYKLKVVSLTISNSRLEYVVSPIR